MLFDLSGRAALVTGASGDIGAAIAKALHGHGAKVGLSGTRRERLDALQAELGERSVVVAGNLADAADTERLARDAEAALGQIDILVNNAGITKDGLLLRMKDEDWDAVLEVDLTAGMRLARTALRGMMKRRWGRIVGIGSVVGSTGNPGQANYAAAKAGMIGFTKALAQEVASRNITVNAVAPGMIKTAMTDVLSDEQRGRMAERIPAGRLGVPEEVAAAVVYLASPEAAYVTGATLHVNGGMAMI